MVKGMNSSATAESKLSVLGYKLQGRLGPEGDVEAYRAVQLSMNRPVIVKVFRANGESGGERSAAFLEEAGVLARLRHENIAGIIDYGEVEGLRFHVMEALQGDTVLDVLRRKGSLGVRPTLEIGLQVCRALSYLSRFGTVHGDVSPANIVITDENHAVLTSFGSRATSPPEDPAVPDIRSDLLSLGESMQEMLTGSSPDREEGIDSPAGVPEDVRAILRRAVSADPDRRFQSPDEMARSILTALESLAGDLDGEAAEPGPEPPVAEAGTPLKEQILALRGERDRLAAENRRLADRIEEVQKDSEARLELKSAELETTREARLAAEERCALLESRVEAAASVTEEECGRLAEERDRVERELRGLREEMETLRSEAEGVQAKLVEAEEDLFSTQEILTRGEMENRTVSEEAERLREQLAEAGAALEAAVAERDAAVSELADLRQSLETREAEKAAAVADSERLRGELEGLRASLTETEVSAERLRREAREKVEKEKALREAEESLAHARREAEEHARSAEEARAELTGRLAELEAALAQAKEEHEREVSRRMAEIAAEKEQTTSELEELRAILSERDEEGGRRITDLEAELEEARRGLAIVGEREATFRAEIEMLRALAVEKEARDAAVEEQRSRRDAARGKTSERIRRLRGDLLGRAEEVERLHHEVREHAEEVEHLRAENLALVADRVEIEAALTAKAAEPAPERKAPPPAPREDRMALVPRGVFIAGEDQGERVETPRHELELPGFWIDVFPVTNLQYAEYVRATGRPPPQHWDGGSIPEGMEQHPVVWVTWRDAVEYAAWRDKRLPTPLEWQKAARGTDGRRYPWGNDAEVERCNCRESGFFRTTPIRQYRTGRSPYGVADLAGNVAEWVADAEAEAGSDAERIVCGGSFKDELAHSVCAARREHPYWWKAAHIGFRCARSK
jgi:formylglycine-generating enzyme required for sulfatase activity